MGFARDIIMLTNVVFLELFDTVVKPETFLVGALVLPYLLVNLLFPQKSFIPVVETLTSITKWPMLCYACVLDIRTENP